MSDLDWAAGLFEGEGSIGIKESGKGVVSVQLASTDEDVVRRFHDVLGDGRVGGPYGPYSGNRKAFWKWYASGQAAARVMRALRPQLGVRRRARVDEALAVFEQRQTEPYYSVSRKGMGGWPTHRAARREA